jgi:hypothetical protein
MVWSPIFFSTTQNNHWQDIYLVLRSQYAVQAVPA